MKAILNAIAALALLGNFYSGAWAQESSGSLPPPATSRGVPVLQDPKTSANDSAKPAPMSDTSEVSATGGDPLARVNQMLGLTRHWPVFTMGIPGIAFLFGVGAFWEYFRRWRDKQAVVIGILLMAALSFALPFVLTHTWLNEGESLCLKQNGANSNVFGASAETCLQKRDELLLLPRLGLSTWQSGFDKSWLFLMIAGVHAFLLALVLAIVLLSAAVRVPRIRDRLFRYRWKLRKSDFHF